MAATSMAITIKEEPKENGVQDNIQVRKGLSSLSLSLSLSL